MRHAFTIKNIPQTHLESPATKETTVRACAECAHPHTHAHESPKIKGNGKKIAKMFGSSENYSHLCSANKAQQKVTVFPKALKCGCSQSDRVARVCTTDVK